MLVRPKIKRPDPVDAGIRPDCCLMIVASFKSGDNLLHRGLGLNRPGSYAVLLSGLGDAVYAVLLLQSDEYVRE